MEQRKETKMTRSGLEIIKMDRGVQIHKHQAVVAIATVSLNKILDIFPSEIWTIKAQTRTYTTTDKLKLKDVGATLFKYSSQHFVLNNTNKDVNLWHEWVGKLRDFMRENKIYDAPVQSLSIRIEDEKLLQTAQEQGILSDSIRKPEFLLQFRRASCEGDSDRARVIEHKINNNLIQNYGFKYDMLHCDKVFATEDVNSVPKERRTPLIDWRTSGVKNYFSPLPIAKRIKVHLKDFGALKFYKPGEFQRLVLARCE